jgi:cell division FtsZ-interacting protein ZapD
MNLDTKVPHNKKRNVGLVYEFLVQKLTKATIENNEKEISLIKKIVKENFSKQSELVKELKLFKQILNSSFSSSEIASKFLEEIKKEVKTINSSKIELEKTNLIHEINKNLNTDGLFFNQYVENYKELATVQTLFNFWRGPILESKLNILVLEDNLISFLTSNRPVKLQPIDLKENLSIDTKLVAKIMHQKFEEKYSSLFDADQKSILNAFIIDDKKHLLEVLLETKQKIVSQIKNKKNYKELLKEVQKLEPVPCGEHCTFFLGVLDVLRVERGEVKE